MRGFFNHIVYIVKTERQSLTKIKQSFIFLRVALGTQDYESYVHYVVKNDIALT